MLAIVNGRLILPDERVGGHFEAISGLALLIEDGRIKDVVSEVRLRADYAKYQTWDAGGRYVSPGFINIHIHGCFGADTMDKKPEAIKTMCQNLPAHGVTSFLPTTITASIEDIQAALDRVREFMKNPWLAQGAEVLGANMEGPFINPAHRGSHQVRHVVPARFSLVEPYADVVKYITVAPEEMDGFSFVDKCREAGIIVSIGHSGAIYEEAVDFFQQGVSHATHLYNAMSPLHHREPGVVGAVLEADNVVAELITDDVHCHPAAQRLACRLKGDKLVLITDSCRACGLGDGVSELGGQQIYVEGGLATLADGTIAASVASMNEVVRNFARNTGLSLPRVVELVTKVPAQELDCLWQRGILEPERLANITVFDDDVNIFATFVRGQFCYGS